MGWLEEINRRTSRPKPLAAPTANTDKSGAPAGRYPWPRRQEPPGVSLLFAPKVHFLNTDLEKECPLRPSVRTHPIRSPRAPCTG